MPCTRLDVDLTKTLAYIARVPDPTTNAEALKGLISRVEQLLAAMQRLVEENRSLRSGQESLMAERANLLAKNEQARSRVEAMIARLKSLEQNG